MRGLKLSNAVLLAGVVVASPWSLSAEEFNLQPLGDSLTRGVGDDADGDGILDEKDEQRGYRDWLQLFLDEDPLGIIGIDATFDFIGNRDNGLGGASTGSFPSLPSVGDPTGTSGSGTPFDDDHAGIPGISADGLASAITSGDPGNGGADLFNGEVADFITLHIGTNDLNGDNQSGADAFDDLVALLDELDTEFQQSSSRIASDAKILVANIVPLFTSAITGTEQVDYNNLIDSLFTAPPPELSAAFTDLLVQVDMEAILLDDTLIEYLLDYNPSTFTDEADLREQLTGSTTGDLVLWTDTGDPTPYNDLLYQDDEIHLTDLGYQLLGYQWYRGFEGLDTGVIPEPTTALMLLLAGGLVGGRRRRGA